MQCHVRSNTERKVTGSWSMCALWYTIGRGPWNVSSHGPWNVSGHGPCTTSSYYKNYLALSYELTPFDKYSQFRCTGQYPPWRVAHIIKRPRACDSHASKTRVVYTVAMEKIINCGVEQTHRQISVNCCVESKIRQRIMKKQLRPVFHSMRVWRSWNATWYFQSEQIPWAYACLQMPTAKFRNRLGVFWKFQNQTKTIFIKKCLIFEGAKRIPKGATKEQRVPNGSQRSRKSLKIIPWSVRSFLFIFIKFFL